MSLTSQDLEAIRAVIDLDQDAVRRGDWDAVTRLFTADAIRFAPHQAPVRGRTALRAWLETFPRLQQFAITADEIIGCDDFAFVRGTYVLTLAGAAGATPQSDRGNYMGVLRKQTDGAWLWSTDMAVSELGQESGA
jgi:ketosteroid isomerase-like protein